jgi:hypothetical protein
MHLYQALTAKVVERRQKNYVHKAFLTIAEILEWASNPDVSSFRLRQPQVRALETYWYLRLVEGTPRIPKLYRQTYQKTRDLLEALGIPMPAFEEVDFNLDALWECVIQDDAFTRRFHLEALRETLTLDYPSYCSDLNPIERFWHSLKDLACANKLQDNIDEVVKAAEKILIQQNLPSATLRFHISKNI